MTKEEIFNILKEAAGFELDDNNNGFGSIDKTFYTSKVDKTAHSQYYKYPEDYYIQDYINIHYPKMVKLLESLPWEMTIQNPYMPKPEEYPTEDGIYITMMDCNEHEVCTNEFHDGRFCWMNKTHIKWWMKLPEE